MFHRTKVSRRRDWLELTLVHLAGIAEALLFLVTLGQISCDLRAWVLFSLFDD